MRFCFLEQLLIFFVFGRQGNKRKAEYLLISPSEQRGFDRLRIGFDEITCINQNRS